MRIGQRGKFIGHEFYDGYLEGGELFTVSEIIEYFEEESTWVFRAKLDNGDSECLISNQVEWLTEEDDLKTLKILIEKYPEQARTLLK
jgi:hypothetical protein